MASKARTAALAIEGAEGECENASPTSPIRLLADCRTVFEDECATELSAADIIAEICKLKENHWADYRRGKPITEKAFADILEPFGIKSKRETCGEEKAVKGGIEPTLRTLGGAIYQWALNPSLALPA